MSGHPLFGAVNHSFITPSGVFSQEQLMVAQILSEFDDQLTLVRVNNPDKSIGEKDCALLVTPHIGEPYVLFYINQADIDYRLIARVYASRMSEHGRSLEDQLSANEMARELYEKKKQEEIDAEKRELARSILKSRLNTYRHNGKVYK